MAMQGLPRARAFMAEDPKEDLYLLGGKGVPVELSHRWGGARHAEGVV